MDLTSLAWTWYVPLLDGNRVRYLAGEESEPVLVELKTPAYGYIRALADRDRQTREQRIAIEKAFFLEHVRGIRALRLDGQPVLTGAELWRLGVEENRLAADLFLELLQALQSQAYLRPGILEGLSGPSGSA